MKKLKYLVYAILITIGLAILNFLISFGYGSFGGFIAEQRSLPKEEKLELFRSDAIKHLSLAHSELSPKTGLTLYEKTYFDKCAKGEHNWKREDSYAYVCSYRMTYYYGTNSDYENLLLDLEKTLDVLGWRTDFIFPEQPNISESISQHSGDIYLAELPTYRKEVDGNYPIENICGNYECKYMYLAINGFNGYGGTWNIGVEEPDPFGFGIGILQEIYENQSNQSPEDISNTIISAGQQPIMIAISKAYFRN